MPASLSGFFLCRDIRSDVDSRQERVSVRARQRLAPNACLAGYPFGSLVLDWALGGGACHASSRGFRRRPLTSGRRYPSSWRMLVADCLVPTRSGCWHYSSPQWSCFCTAGWYAGTSACSKVRVFFRWYWPTRFCQAVGRTGTSGSRQPRGRQAKPTTPIHVGTGAHVLTPVGCCDNNE